MLFYPYGEVFPFVHFYSFLFIMQIIPKKIPIIVV